MKISVFIFIGFLVILVMFSITTYINFELANDVNENSKWLEKSTTVVRNGNRFQRNVLNMVSHVRGYIFTGEKYFIRAYDSAYIENEALIKELAPLISPEHKVQQELLQKVDQTNTEWVTHF